MFSRNDFKITIIIPAMGNCHLIPRKFLRKLNGMPLILYSLNLSKSISEKKHIIVICDDEELNLIVKRNGIKSHLLTENCYFPMNFSDPFVISRLIELENENKTIYDFVIWLGPSSPLLRERDIFEAISFLSKNDYDAVFSTSKEIQRAWLYSSTYQPSYGEVENKMRNGLMHKETGAFFIMKRNRISDAGYIGKSAHPFFIHESHSIEINSFNDWWVAEKYLKRKHILFVVSGNTELGMGHVYRALSIAQELLDHEVEFLCTKESRLAYNYINRYLYKCSIQDDHADLLNTVINLSPDVVINDILNTEQNYIKKLKEVDIKVINFEDEGEGIRYADLVINALYEKSIADNMLVGHQYFCLRDEFLGIQPSKFKNDVEKIILTFGGTDVNNITLRILKLIQKQVLAGNRSVDIITGPGYLYNYELIEFINSVPDEFKNRINLISNGTKQISEYMQNADIAITSAGRTVFELTHLKIPSIIIAANERELLHTFGKSAGHLFLGLNSKIKDNEILDAINLLLNDNSYRMEIFSNISKYDFTKNKINLIKEIEFLL